MGETPDAIVLVESCADVEALAFPDGTKLAYVTQTTLSVDETGDIITALRRRFPAIYAPKKEDICYATSNRQWAVKEMLAEIDLLLVIGSRNSSNSNRLVEVARAGGVAGAPDRRRDRDRRGAGSTASTVVGLTSGASAPEKLVAARLRLVPRARRDRDRAVPARRRGRRVPAADRAAPRARARRRPALAERGLPGRLTHARAAACRRARPRRRASPRRSGRANASRSASGIQRRIRSVISRPDVLAQHVDRRGSGRSGAPSSRSSSSSVVSSATVTPSSEATAQPVEADALDEHLVRLEHVAVDLEAAAVELLEAPRGERGAHLARAPRRASARARGRFGFTRSSEASTSPNSTSLHAQLVGDLVGVRARASGAPATTSRRSGWRSFSPDVDARLPAELDDPAHLGDLGEQRARPARPPRASRRGGPTPAPPWTRFRQRWSARNGITGAITRSDCTSAYQSVRNAASSSP